MHRPFLAALLLGLAAAAAAKGKAEWRRPVAPVSIDGDGVILVADGYLWSRVPGYGSVWIKDGRSPALELSVVRYNRGHADPDSVLQALRDKRDAVEKGAAAKTKHVKISQMITKAFKNGATCHFYLSSEKGASTSLLVGELLMAGGANYSLKGRVSSDDKGLVPWMTMLATVVPHRVGRGARAESDEQAVPIPAKAIPLLR